MAQRQIEYPCECVNSMFGHLSIRSKLLILLLLSGIGGALVLGTMSLLRASDA